MKVFMSAEVEDVEHAMNLAEDVLKWWNVRKYNVETVDDLSLSIVLRHKLAHNFKH